MTKRKYSQNELVTRAYVTDFKASVDESGQGIIMGTPVVFNQEARIRDWAGEFIERIAPEALSKTDMSDVRLFINHDMKNITLARSKNGKGTMQFEVGSEGLNFVANLDIDNNMEARALHSAVMRGDMDSMSFGFRVAGDKWDDIESDCPIRTVTDISIIHEISVVNYPAYQATSVSARSSEETDYSPLAEARAKHAEETVINRCAEMVEVERLKNINNMRFF